MCRLNCWCGIRLLSFFLIASLALPASAQKWNKYGPGTRSQPSAIYDSSTNQMIVFGGQHAPTNIDFNETWSLQTTIPASTASFRNLQWAKVSATGKPPSARFGHTAVYNASSNRMIVFGGGTGFPGPCANDLWVLKHPNGVGGGPAWVQLTASGTLPGVREGHTAAYDANSNTMIVFGGTDCNGNYYSDLWILSNADGTTGTPTWTLAAPLGGGPSARSQASAIYDSTNNVMTIFAGGTISTTAFNDVWTLSNANGLTGTPTWTQQLPSGTTPTARSGQSAVYDSANNRMIVHGGINTRGSVQNDTWILTGANGIGSTPAWTQLTLTDTAPNRRSHTAIYDPTSNEMVIFGGSSQLPQVFTDDHVWILTQANGLP